jgi:hypothetical protein
LPFNVTGKIIIANGNQQTMRKIFVLLILIAAICEASDKPPVLPGNKSSWLDQQPISWNQLRGKVVMLNVWTFG